ncbi:MAG: ABC transporter ATP-binding protein [Hyphomicrobiales bacterium]|nr:MAG: ABC transporter ATP-binding protein [Hyphomicrobiales bacterium]
MSDVVIRADGLGKKYLIGHQSAARERYTALRDVVGRQMRGFIRSARDMALGRQIISGDEVEEFWALKGVSFEITRGEVVGIIGRNGAGKSTLLKVLSRITEPSTGRVEIKGRVASLLEVGTGFHPELTGRENIYLNGAILGMSRAEIRRKFDEIVAFAEVEKFLDTPVKRYSSGMYVRLAFAVAAHLEPEILIVDEVLAVGDAEFQKKCLGKMQDVAGGGRTVLFVSHNMGAVRQLCSTGLHFANGALIQKGNVSKVLSGYALQDADVSVRGASPISVTRLEPLAPESGGALSVRLSLNGTKCEEVRELALLLYAANGTRIAIADLRTRGGLVLPLRVGPSGCFVDFHFPSLPLVEGEYSFGAYLVDSEAASDCLDIGRVYITPKVSAVGVVPYSSTARGFLELEFGVNYAEGA